MARQRMAPWLVSIRRPDDPGELTEPVDADVFYLPPADEVRALIDARIAANEEPARIRRAIAEWRKKPDSNRVFEAVWLGPKLREKGITHVHAHFGAMAARTAWMVKRLFGISYSFTGHANDIFCENDFPVTNAMLVRDARLVVTETDYARLWMEERYPFARGKIVRVFNGISTEGFMARCPSVGAPKIVSVGRYVEKKGFADLIDACRILHERGRKFECRIVGGGPMEHTLQTRIDRANLSGIVTLLGPRSQAEIRRLLAEAHVFALACVSEASGGSDNLPTVIMEAMLARLPVVSTRVAGVPEMIRDGESGFLVQPNDPQAISAALEKILGDSALAEKFGEVGHAAATERFAIERTVNALKHLLVRRCRVAVPKGACEFDPELRAGWWSRFFPLNSGR